jgi:putative ABC transport system permease protein
VRALDRKLLRDLARHRGQVFSIALLVACGVMTVVGMRSTYDTLRLARDSYYDRYRFAHVFASLKRAPESLSSRIAAISGVGAVQTRVVFSATIDVPGLTEPAAGLFVSVPSTRQQMLNDIHIVEGRYVSSDRDDEILTSTVFSAANNLHVGDTLGAVINGRWKRLHISGIATSPEYSYEIGGGELFVDNSRFGIMWMRREALAAAAGMEGAFNAAALTLAPDADERPVIEALDRLLAPYGGVGAVGRADQPSNNIITNELSQLSAIATIFPLFFILIAAFLLNVVLTRLIATQRGEIGTLKSFGYDDFSIAMHFLGFAVASVMLGSILGMLGGIWLGNLYTDLYRRYFGFPNLEHRIGWGTMVAAIAISAAAALSGAARSVRSAALLPPAQAMRPPSPSRYRPLLLERIGLRAPRSPAVRMIMRNLERHPFRTLASSVGISLASAVLVAGMYPFNAIDRLMDLQFRQAQREELAVSFASPLQSDVVSSLEAVPRVRRAELTRSTLARISVGDTRRTIALTGIDTTSTLRVLIDAVGNRYRLPVAGLVLTKSVADVLGAIPGDTVNLTLLEKGSIRKVAVVSGIIDEPIGFGAYVARHELNRLLGDDNLATGASLAIERGYEDEVAVRLREMPVVSGVASRLDLLAYFERSVAESILVSAGIVIFAAVVIAAGVVYNGARIALSERGRELATLRVLGFTRRECSTFFLAEQGAIIAIGLPLGAVAGYGLAALLAAAFRTERYSFPVVIYPTTYIFSVLVVLGAATVVAFLVRRRIDRLDMIATLKSGD